ncbi:MAG: clostripain-related cysteine peptidase [Kouleothrix sp.]
MHARFSLYYSLRRFGSMLRLPVFVLVAFSLSGCLGSAPANEPTTTPKRPTATPKPAANGPTATPAPAAPAEWTVLVYLDGDNDLETEALADYAEMATVGSSAAVNIVVQFDRISSNEDWDDSSNGDWRGVKRFRVERNKKPVKGNQLADLGELDMGSPRTLADFASWGIATYPARHYALIFWDHGASWPGVASDDTSDGDMLTLPELAKALADVQKRTGVSKLDLIGFDACLMSQLDVFQAIAPFGKIAIGSADLEPGEGWAWNAWLRELANQPPQDAAVLAPSIIKSFTAFYKKEKDPSVTLAAFDLAKINALAGQLDTLASALIHAMPTAYKSIGKARAHAAEYAEGDTDISAIDLGHLADSLVTAKLDPQVTSAARTLSQMLKDARIAAGFGADQQTSSGMSVYFPWKKKNYDSSYLAGSPLTAKTRWDEFLQAFYMGGKGTPTRAQLAPPQLSQLEASAYTSVTLSSTIAGDDTADVYYFVGAADPANPEIVRILSMDYLYPPGAQPGDPGPSWKDGDAVELRWPATSWYLSNGKVVVLAPLAPSDYGSTSYSVEGTYTSAKTGTSTPVSIEFAVEQGRGVLQHMWAFDKGGSNNPRPRELSPRAGDTFTPDIETYNTQSGDDSTLAGQPIVFTSTPLVLFESPVPAGDYVLGLMVEDVAGEISDQYADVVVTNPNGAILPPTP